MALSKIERLSHYGVVIIAVSALIVSIWQGRIMQKHNKLSVKPYLDYFLFQGDTTLTVKFYNEGFGPAIIKKIRFTYDGKDYTSLAEVLLASDEKKNILQSVHYSQNTIVAPNTEKLIVKLKGGPHLRGIKVRLYYETIYEEKNEYEFSF